MSGAGPVRPVDLIYCYDGSLDGFLSCVFESFAQPFNAFFSMYRSLNKRQSAFRGFLSCSRQGLARAAVCFV